MIRSLRSRVVDDPADGVVGQRPVEGLDELGGGEVADPVPGVDGGDAEGDQDVALAGAGRADQADVLGGPDPLERGQVVEGGRRDRGGGDVELVEASWRPGTPAGRIRVRALDSSRAAISASTRVRRNSSGFHRWVFAVTSSSGARRRIAAIFSRFSPSLRSAASGGGAVLTADPPIGRRSRSRPGTGSAPPAG